MIGEYIVLHCLLWVTTVAFLSLTDFIAKKRLGEDDQSFINLRMPKFIALSITSVTIIMALYVLKNDLVEGKVIDYLAIPYFAANSYFIAAFFRELKTIKSLNTRKDRGCYGKEN